MLNSCPTNPRVLHVTTTIDRGGAENYLMDLIKGQIDAGYEAVSCAYLKGGDYWASQLLAAGVGVHNLALRFYGDPGPVFRLRRLISQFKPDVIHVHGAPVELYVVAGLAGSVSDIVLVITRHEPRRRLFNIPGYALFDRKISRAADLIISVSGSVRLADIARRPELELKEIVIHHGIKPDFCENAGVEGRTFARRQLGAGEEDVLIGTIARHTPEKSIDTLLRAFRTCINNTGDAANLKLALIGQGPLTDQLKALAVELDVDKRVTWFHFREDIPAVMLAFDIFALASKEEGFGIVLLEAMICARPVVACAIDAIPEIVIHEETGLVVPPLDPDAFASALSRLSLDWTLRSRLGKAGRRRVDRHFTVRKMQNQTLEAYERLVTGKLSAQDASLLTG